MKKIISALLVFVLLINMTSPVAAVIIDGRWHGKIKPFFDYMTQTEGGQASDNQLMYLLDRYNSYEIEFPVYASVINSYMYENEAGGYGRVEAIDGKVYVEYYSEDFKYVSGQELDMELSEFGGCYIGEKYNFLVFGQPNIEESDEVEVLRTVKYDKEWNRIGSASVYGANTQYPFLTGSLRMTEVNGLLCIHTCHYMYASSDGFNHQANMTYIYDQESLELTQSYNKIMNIDEGYVSHSFDQYVVSDGTYLYRMDHGDAYPRAVVATKCKLDRIDKCTSKGLVVIKTGKIGDNATGISTGGFDIGGDYLLSTGASVDYELEDVDIYKQRNVYLTSTKKDFSTKVNKIWLTDYEEGSDVEPGIPKLIKASDDTFYVIWEEVCKSEKTVYLKYAKVSADGTVLNISDRIYGRLSDCQPVYTDDGKIVWYVTHNGCPIFYSIDPEKPQKYIFSKIDLSECEINMASEDCVYSDIGDNIVKEIVKYKGILLDKNDYNVTYSADTGNYVGLVKVTIEGKGYFKGKVEKSYIIRPEEPHLLYRYSYTYDTITLRWDKCDFATGYEIQQKINGVWTDIADADTTEYKVTGLEKSSTYDFRIRAYTINDGCTYYGDYKEISTKTRYYVETPDVYIKEAEPEYLKLAWQPVEGADHYTVSWRTMTNDVSSAVSYDVTEPEYIFTEFDKIVTVNWQYMNFSVWAEAKDEEQDGEGFILSETCNFYVDKDNLPYYRINENTVEVSLDEYCNYYDDTQIVPSVSVKLTKALSMSMNKKLTEGTDYTVKYYENEQIGIARLVIEGIGKYKGSVEKTFKIVPSSVCGINGECTANNINMTWYETAGAKWYIIYMYVDNEWKMLGKSEKAAYSVENLSSDTQYKFKIIACAEKNGEIYESLYPAECEFTTATVVTPGPGENDEPIITKREKISSKQVVLEKTKYAYTGKTIKPSVIVRNKAGWTIYESVDYKISYSKSAKLPGIYSVTVKGIGAYKGTITKTFKIYPKQPKIQSFRSVNKKQLNLKWKKTSSKVSGYEIWYADNEKLKNKKKVIVAGNSKTSWSGKVKIKSGKSYHIQIRSFVYVKSNGKKVKLNSEWDKRQFYMYN